MANILYKQVLVDTNRRALVKWVGVSDGTTEANTLLLDVSTLAYSLNANNQILGTGSDKKSLYRTSIKRIYGQGVFKNKGHIFLKWQGTPGSANTPFISIGDGHFDYNFDVEGMTASIPIVDAANSTGNIVFSSVGNSNGDALTMFIELKKDGRDYDQGQTADPTAFNVIGVM